MKYKVTHDLKRFYYFYESSHSLNSFLHYFLSSLQVILQFFKKGYFNPSQKFFLQTLYSS
jgi:hypothetical protein